MCSIFGMLFFNGVVPTTEHRGILTRLMLAGQTRGTDATGLSFAKKDEVVGYKLNVSAAELLDLEGTSKVINDNLNSEMGGGKLYSIIGHTRQKTQGSPINPDNNHPISCGSLIGVHNGHIGNDNDIFEWLSLVSDGLRKRKAQVDSEAIFALIRYYAEDYKNDFYATKPNKRATLTNPVVKAIIKAVPRLRGSLACAMHDIENPKALWLFRTSNPIVVKYYKAENMVIFASTVNMINNAIGPTKFSMPDDIAIDRNKGLCFNMETSNYNRFTLESLSYSSDQF